MSEEGVIQQVQLPSADIGTEFPMETVLNLRGHKLKVRRDQLLGLPENILFSLSSGLNYDEGDAPMENEEDGNDQILADSGPYDDEVSADFSPQCFEYILHRFGELEESLDPKQMSIDSFEHDFTTGLPMRRGPSSYPESGAGSMSETESMFEYPDGRVPDVLIKRPGVIALREDLEYYCLNPKLSRSQLQLCKLRCGSQLVSHHEVFEGLRQKDSFESPEYHLMQMLCLAGFSSDTHWEFRQREPARTALLSLQLVKIPIPDDPNPETIQALQKLLLFWKKPAKKCWWDKFDMDVPDIGTVTIHARRVWTLELSILGLA